MSGFPRRFRQISAWRECRDHDWLAGMDARSRDEIGRHWVAAELAGSASGDFPGHSWERDPARIFGMQRVVSSRTTRQGESQDPLP